MNFIDLGLSVLWSNENYHNDLYEYNLLYKDVDNINDYGRLPTVDEVNELINNCEWIYDNNGFYVKGNNNQIHLSFNYIDIPKKYLYEDGEINYKGIYWIKSPDKEKYVLSFIKKPIIEKVNELSYNQVRLVIDK